MTTDAPGGSQEPPGRPLTGEETVAWFDAWERAWEGTESEYDGTYFGAAVYSRVTALALAQGVAPYQAAMRAFIRREASLPPADSVTARSLDRRARRRARDQERGSNG